jgi:arylsulfatase A-like enzyme
VLLACAAAGCGGRGGDSRPNVILISIDTLRADHLGCYGYPRETTPHVDAFASGAVLFAETVAPSPQTLPSHASIFTSLVPSHHGALANNRFKLGDDAITMAEILKEHGYATVSFNDGGLMSESFGFSQGFDLYESTTRKSAFSTRVAPAKKWLSEHGDNPFFLFLHTYEVHVPLAPDKAFLDIFDAGYAGPLPDSFRGKVLHGVRDGDIEITPADLDHIINLYDATIRSMDDAFQDLIGFLRDQDLYDNSIIIFTSDHGEEYGERGRIAMHGPTLYDEVLLVPLIIKFPEDRYASTVVDSQVRSIDILPTVLEVLGIDAPASSDGMSLLDFARGETSRDLPALSEKRLGTLMALRDGSWKVIRAKREVELFDLETDPSEKKDLADENPEIGDRLQVILDEILDSHPSVSTPHAPDEKAIEQLRALGYIK